ncbi:hypothetical protein SDC9_94210 [bioreactor metagenome]|uniref:Uncharacterized protein n=1 Tax=bioreactor metagenome TaxID=1076179 RepID=A0A645A2T4_9ZZZZ
MKKYITTVNISIDVDTFDSNKLNELYDFINNSETEYNGNPIKCMFYIYGLADDSLKKYSFSHYGFQLNYETIRFISELFGKENVALSTVIISAPVNNKRNWRR